MKRQFSLLRSIDGKNYFRPFALVTSLFLLWGFAHGLLDVLDKHFQNTLHVTKAQSGFVQFSLYIGYLAMSYPAGLFMKRYGYKLGIILGLTLFAGGAFLFYPAAQFAAFVPFLMALFINVWKRPLIPIRLYWDHPRVLPVVSILPSLLMGWGGS